MSDQQAFAARDGARQVVRGLGLAVPDLIGESLVPDARHDRRRKVLQTFEAVKRVVRLHSDGVDRRVVLLQAPRDADECAGRAEARDEVRDAPARLLEYLDRRAFVMRARVGGVGVLIGIEVRVGVVSHQLAHHPNRAVRALARVAVHDLRAKRFDEGLALGADVARHYELHAIALGSPDERVGDAGVARRGVDDHPAPCQRAATLAVLDHRKRGPVLHRPARVEPLGLGVHLEARELALEHAHPQKRRVADLADDPLGHADPHHLRI